MPSALWSVGELVQATKLNKLGFYLLYDTSDAGVAFPVASVTTPTLDTTNFAHGIVFYEGSSNAAAANSLMVQINGDTAAHYYYQSLRGNNGAVTCSSTVAGVSATVGMLGGTANASYRGGGIILIPNWGLSTAHPMLGIAAMFTGSGSGTFWNHLSAAMKGDTSAAISTLTFLDAGGQNLLANTRISVFGIPA
jgi:hypothetical protein